MLISAVTQAALALMPGAILAAPVVTLAATLAEMPEVVSAVMPVPLAPLMTALVAVI